MRILILSDRIPPENVGGAEKIAWTLAGGLAQAGHDVHVVAATNGPSFEEERDGLPTYHVHSHYPERFRAWLSLYNPQTHRPLRSLIERIQPDVINAHNIHRDLGYSSLTAPVPTVLTCHDVMPIAYGKLSHFVQPDRCGVAAPAEYRLPPLYNLRQMRLRYNPLRNAVIRRIVGKHTQARTCVSHALRQALEANGLPPLQVIHNGLDPAKYVAPESEIEALRQRLNLVGRKVILFAGRIAAAKGSQQLLAALNETVKRVPSALLLVLTAASLDPADFERPEFRQLRDQHVRLGGWLAGNDLIAAYCAADVVAVPSIYLDPAPTVNLEAMATSRALISTCYGGSPEYVVDNQTGVIVNPFDMQTFSEKLVELLENTDQRRQLGEAGHQRLVTNFTLDKQVGEMVAVYEKAIQGFGKALR